MADVLKAIGLKYVAINPAAGFRSLQESIINYSGNKNPEIITCLHEETATHMAQGYAKAAGKPIGVMVHGTVGQGGERGAGPKIYPNPFPYAAFVMQVRKPRQGMPPYTDKHVSDQDLADMYHYLFSTKPAPAAKDIPLLKDF